MRTHGPIHAGLVLAGLLAVLLLVTLWPSPTVEAQDTMAAHHSDGVAVSIPIPAGWTSTDRGSHTRVTSPDGQLAAYILSAEANRLDDLGPAILASLGGDGQGLAKEHTIPVIDTDLVAVLFATPQPDESAYAICIRRNGLLHALVFRGTTRAFRRHLEQVNAIAEGFEVEGRGRVLKTSLMY
jgi:hypothetical protein